MPGGPFQKLPDDVMLRIFNHLSFPARRCILPLVCKEWHTFTQRSPGLWSSVILDGEEEEEIFDMVYKAHPVGAAVVNEEPRWPVMKTLAVVRWFQANAAAVQSVDATFREPEEDEDGEAAHVLDFNWDTGGLVACLIGAKDSLKELCIHDIDWINDSSCFIELSWLKKLEVLDLSCKSDQNFTSTNFEGLGALTNLKRLRIGNLESGIIEYSPKLMLIQVPDSFSQLPNLADLSLCSISIMGAYSRLESMTSLTRLALNGIGETVSLVAAYVACLSGLVELDLSRNRDYLLDLPDLGNLKRLRSLRCTSNSFSRLPVTQLTGLKAVQVLDFNFCHGMQITENVVELSILVNLVVLSVRGSNYSPQGVGGLMRLVDAVKSAEPQVKVKVLTRGHIPVMGLCAASVGARNDFIIGL